MLWYIEKREFTAVCTFPRYVTNRVAVRRHLPSMIVPSYAFRLEVIGSKIEEIYNKDYALAPYPYRSPPPLSDPCASCNAVVMTM